jgi:hypothetical protein
MTERIEMISNEEGGTTWSTASPAIENRLIAFDGLDRRGQARRIGAYAPTEKCCRERRSSPDGSRKKDGRDAGKRDELERRKRSWVGEKYSKFLT